MSYSLSPYLTMTATTQIMSNGQTVTLGAHDAVVTLLPTAAGDDLLGLTGGADGRIIFLVAASRTLAIDIIGESLSATAANRFADSGTLDPNTASGYIYDGAISRWTRFL